MGVTTKVVDYTGLHALSLLIAKQPKLASQALDQCFSLDKKSRELKVGILKGLLETSEAWWRGRKPSDQCTVEYFY